MSRGDGTDGNAAHDIIAALDEEARQAIVPVLKPKRAAGGARRDGPSVPAIGRSAGPSATAHSACPLGEGHWRGGARGEREHERGEERRLHAQDPTPAAVEVYP